MIYYTKVYGSFELPFNTSVKINFYHKDTKTRRKNFYNYN